MRPLGHAYGYVVCGGDKRHRIENTGELRDKVLDLAGRIRTARLAADQPIAVTPGPRQCRPCGVQASCSQARL